MTTNIIRSNAKTIQPSALPYERHGKSIHPPLGDEHNRKHTDPEESAGRPNSFGAVSDGKHSRFPSIDLERQPIAGGLVKAVCASDLAAANRVL